MNTEDAIELNEFEKEWIEGEVDQAQPDPEAAAVIEAAQADIAKSEADYVQAHGDLESEQK